MKIFKFDDGEIHWIAAVDQEIAETYFKESFEGDSEYDIREATEEEVNAQVIDNSKCDKNDKYFNLKSISLNQILDVTTEFPTLLACSIL